MMKQYTQKSKDDYYEGPFATATSSWNRLHRPLSIKAYSQDLSDSMLAESSFSRAKTTQPPPAIKPSSSQRQFPLHFIQNAKKAATYNDKDLEPTLSSTNSSRHLKFRKLHGSTHNCVPYYDTFRNTRTACISASKKQKRRINLYLNLGNFVIFHIGYKMVQNYTLSRTDGSFGHVCRAQRRPPPLGGRQLE